MRPSSLVTAVTALLALALTIPSADAQDLQVNQRLTAPTADADTYAGVAVSQLILALGLSLQGIPAADLHDRTTEYRLPASDTPTARTYSRVPRLLASKPAAPPEPVTTAALPASPPPPASEPVPSDPQ